MAQNDPTADQPRVHAITDASDAASIESSRRLRSYGIKMALRAVLFIAGAIIAATWNIWVGVALLAASAILPWIAVMDANLIANPETDSSAQFLKAPPQDQLTAGASDAPASPEQPAGQPAAHPAAEDDVLEGSFEPDPSDTHDDAAGQEGGRPDGRL